MLRVNQVKIRTEHTPEQLKRRTAELLHIPAAELLELKIVRQSVDARKKPEIFYSYSLDVRVKHEEKLLNRFRGRENQVSRLDGQPYRFPEPGERKQKFPTVIAGMGPAGLFCAYYLALHGYRIILLERGKCVEERQKDVERFWETGVPDPVSNVQFGEGGAGTFSDGKLNTLVKDRDGRNRAVLETFVKFGAKESICYEAKPHIGTDVLCSVVRNLRNEIVRLGGEVRFQSQVTDIVIRDGTVAGVTVNGTEQLACEQLVLAIGHSARDTFAMLYGREVPMEAKSFAVGLRVEHPQEMINVSQYGMKNPGNLGAAAYKLTAKGKNGRGVYTFCMCPGGYVVNASSEPGHTAVNGMSYSGRSGRAANSAVIVAVTPEDYGSDHPLAGIAFQRRLERRAYEIGQGKIPVQRYGDFKRRVEEREKPEGQTNGEAQLPEAGEAVLQETDGAQPHCKGGFVWADVSSILPEECNHAFLDGMESFGRQIRGFDAPDTLLLGVESRTSSPVRLQRDETMQSAIRGLYPCGEGAGYAGGITSAAMDGLRVAEQIASVFAPTVRS